MACLRLYGDPAARQSAEQVLASFGANIEPDNGTPDSDLLCRVLSRLRKGGTVDARLARASDDPQRLVELVRQNPELLNDTLVVRGRSFMLGNDPARLQSLMY